MPRLIRRRTIALASLVAALVVSVVAWVAWQGAREHTEEGPSPQPRLEAPVATRAPSAATSPAVREPTPDAATPSQVAAQGSERAQMARIEAAVRTDPELALELIQALDAERGSHHEERRLLEIEALVALQRIGLSHAKASAFYRSFPGSARAAAVERLTGYHPRPPGHE